MQHQPHTEIWATDGALSGEVLSNVPQYEGQKEPYVVCSGIGNDEAAKLIAEAPMIWRSNDLRKMLQERSNQRLAQVQCIAEQAIVEREELMGLLERAWPYLHTAEMENFGYTKDKELTKLYNEVKTILGK